MTIVVTWQLRVTLDSIRNSCDVCVLDYHLPKSSLSTQLCSLACCQNMIFFLSNILVATCHLWILCSKSFEDTIRGHCEASLTDSYNPSLLKHCAGICFKKDTFFTLSILLTEDKKFEWYHTTFLDALASLEEPWFYITPINWQTDRRTVECFTCDTLQKIKNPNPAGSC